ncbi:hypothetical protein OKW11_001627 [Pseudomonas baetica]|nr:hypothetical protein [Pseudomonas baetica]
MNKHRRRHIDRYSQTGWEIQTTWERRREVAKVELMVLINPRHLNVSNFIYKS